MSLTIYGFYDYPNDFAVTKIEAPIEQCPFLLDFARPLQIIRRPRWIGPIILVAVPVVHLGEPSGGYVIGVRQNEPYLVFIKQLWKQHRGQPRALRGDVDGLQVAADFATHFPEDSP